MSTTIRSFKNNDVVWGLKSSPSSKSFSSSPGLWGGWERSQTIVRGLEKTKYSSNKDYKVEDIKRVKLSNSECFNLRGFEINLPSQLSGIKNSLIQAGPLLDLKEDWDDYGANATNKIAFKKAIDFVVSYSVFVLKNYGVVIDSPLIDVLRDGSMTAQWETNDAQLLIIFKKEESEYSYFYAEEKNTSIPVPFNRAVKNGNEIDTTTAVWMSEKLK